MIFIVGPNFAFLEEGRWDLLSSKIEPDQEETKEPASSRPLGIFYNGSTSCNGLCSRRDSEGPQIQSPESVNLDGVFDV